MEIRAEVKAVDRFNLEGTALYLSLAAIFVTQAAGVSMSMGQRARYGKEELPVEGWRRIPTCVDALGLESPAMMDTVRCRGIRGGTTAEDNTEPSILLRDARLGKLRFSSHNPKVADATCGIRRRLLTSTQRSFQSGVYI